MTERTYVFKLQGDAGQLQAATESAGKAFDGLAAKTEAAATRSIAADRSAAQARAALESATTSLGATSFVNLDKATTSLGATAFAAKGVSDAIAPIGPAAGRIPAGVRPADQAIKGLGVTAGQTRAALQQLPAQFTDIATQLAGGQNPFLILLQQGGQIKDSFGGIGPTLSLAAQAITPLRVAIGLGATAVTGLVYAYAQGVAQSKEFNASQVLTNGFAGKTEGQFNALARSVAANGAVTVSAAREIAQALASTGEVGPRVFGAATEAGARYAKATGQNAADVAKDFAGMSGDVAKWASEHNRQLNFITAAQYDQIKSLQDQGRAAEAQGIVYDALNERLRRLEPNLGTLDKALKIVTNSWHSFWDSAFDIGRTETIDDKLAAVQRRIALSKAPAVVENAGGAGFVGASAGRRQSTQALQDIKDQTELVALSRRKLREEDNAFATADRAETNKAAIAFRDKLDGILVKAKTAGEYQKKVNEFQAGFRRAEALGTPVSAADQKAALDQIKKDSTPTPVRNRAAEKLDNRFEDRRNALTAEGIKLDAETRSFELYGRSIDKSRVALLELEIAQGKLKGLSAARIAELKALAVANDTKDRGADQAKANAEVDRSIGLLRDQALAKQATARETEISTRLAAIEHQRLSAGNEIYLENAASIRTWVNLKHDKLAADRAAAEDRSVDAEIERMDAQTQAIGLTSIALQKAAASSKLWNDAQAAIAADHEARDEILAAYEARLGRVTAAIERNYTASRSFETGASSALQRYGEDATNYGAAAERAIGGGLNRAEDAIVKFAKTGKLSFGDLFQYMADEYIRQQARMVVASASGSNGWLSTLGNLAMSYFGGGTGMSTNNTGTSLPTAGGRATGGMVAAGSLHPVNELGPELLSQGGKDYLMVGGQGGYVKPLGKPIGGGGSGGSAGAAPVVNVRIDTPPGYTGKVEQRRNDQGGVDIYAKVIEMVAADISGGGQLDEAIKGRYSLGAGGSTPRMSR